MLLALGICAALLETGRSGQGQVVDAAMVDGAALLMTMFHAFTGHGHLGATQRGTNMLDTGAHFYDVYETADGKYVSIGSIEPQFYAELLKHTGLDGEDLPVAARPGAVAGAEGAAGRDLQQKTRDEWCEIMEGTDVCFAPGAVADRGARAPAQRAPRHVRRGGRHRAAGAGAPLQPHAGARSQPPAAARRPAHRRGARRLGRVAPTRIAELRRAGAVA